MSFGFGIGDVITAINALVRACDKIVSVPRDISEASQDLERLLNILTSIGKVTTEKTSVAHRDPSIKEQLILDIKEVTEDVGRLRNHLRIWKRQEKRPPLHSAAQRILFAFYNIPEIKEIRSNFDEYRKRLSLMLHVLSITSHNEARKAQNEMLDVLRQIKASFAEYEKRKGSRLSLEEDRTREREGRYLEWESRLEEDISPGKAAELEAFFGQKQQTLEQSASEGRMAQEHLDEISSRLWNSESSEPIPQIRVTGGTTDIETWAKSVSSPARRERRRLRQTTSSRENSQACDRREPRTPTSRELTGHMPHSQSSASSRSNYHRRRGLSQGSDSTSTNTSRRGSIIARINPWFQQPSSASSRRTSGSNSRVQSHIGTPRQPADNNIIPEMSALSLGERQDAETWTTVLPRAPPPRSSTMTTKNFAQSSRRNHPPVAQPRPLTSNSQNPRNILCVNWDNNAFSQIAQTYFELLRLWTINTSSLWPFDRVESSGICMNAKTDIDAVSVMELLAPPRSNFRSRDFPSEKDRLLNRMANTEVSKFRKEYLDQFRYILCFDEKSYEAVTGKTLGLGEVATDDPQVRCIPLQLDLLAGKKLHEAEARAATTKIKVVVEAFMEKRLGWKWPDRKLVEGHRRTLQIPVHKKMKGLIIGTAGATIKEMREKSNCAILIFDEGLNDKCALVLAIGQVKDLEWVEKRLKDIVPPKYYWG